MCMKFITWLCKLNSSKRVNWLDILSRERTFHSRSGAFAVVVVLLPKKKMHFN